MQNAYEEDDFLSRKFVTATDTRGTLNGISSRFEVFLRATDVTSCISSIYQVVLIKL